MVRAPHTMNREWLCFGEMWPGVRTGQALRRAMALCQVRPLSPSPPQLLDRFDRIPKSLASSLFVRRCSAKLDVGFGDDEGLLNELRGAGVPQIRRGELGDLGRYNGFDRLPVQPVLERVEAAAQFASRRNRARLFCGRLPYSPPRRPGVSID